MPYTPAGTMPRAAAPNAINPGVMNPGLGFNNRNAIAQALMNVNAPPPGAPAAAPGPFSGTAGPMPTAPPLAAAGPQYGTTSGTAGPMPPAPLPSAAPGVPPTFNQPMLPQQSAAAPTLPTQASPVARGLFGGR